MAVTGFSIGGIDLRTKAINLRSVDGWDTFAGLRGAPFVHPYRTGEDISGRKFYNGRDLTLNFEVFPRNTSGGVTTTPGEHLQDNLDQLFGLLHHSTDTITVTRTMPDASTRTAEIRVLGAVQAQKGSSVLSRVVVVRARMGHPFWRGTAVSISASGTLVNGGNAPITDGVVTFTTAGSISMNGDTLTASGACVVDIGAGTVTDGGSDADNKLTYDEPYFLIAEPGNNTVVISGTVQFDGYEAWF